MIPTIRNLVVTYLALKLAHEIAPHTAGCFSWCKKVVRGERDECSLKWTERSLKWTERFPKVDRTFP